MNDCRFLIQCAVTCSTLATLAMTAPVVTDVALAQEKSSRKVTISYRLEGPGFVTARIETNTLANGVGEWVDIGVANYASGLKGDVNGLVPAGARRITWNPRETWPDRSIPDNRVRVVVKAFAPSEPPRYLAVDLDNPRAFAFADTAESVPGGVTNDVYKTRFLLLRRIPAANRTFRQGAPVTEADYDRYSEIAHQTTLSADFYLGVYEVTQDQYRRVMGVNPSLFSSAPDSPMRPVERINGALAGGADNSDMSSPAFVPPTSSFTGKLRELNGGALAFNLPTEAQWEFACRANSGASRFDGGNEAGADLDLIAWHADNWANDPAAVANGNRNQTHAVGLLAANAFGLYDMMGNVAEWTRDGHSAYTAAPTLDPCTGAVPASQRIMRGGAYNATRTSNWFRSAGRMSAKWWSHGEAQGGGADITEEEYAARGFRVCCPAVVGTSAP